VAVQRIGVVGLGAVGAGIAQVAVEAGFDVVGREVSEELGAAAADRIGHFLTRKVEKGQVTQDERDSAVARLTTTTGLEALADCDLVIEAIVEQLDAKRDLRAELSSDEAVATALDVVARLGKIGVPCHDTPGFVVNRVLIPLLNDCVRVLDEARVTPEDLDAAMKHGAGWPMGPCTLVDLVGIDVHVHASEALYEKLREPRMAPPPRLVAMRNAGLLGRKSGRGFYTYD
jgi:3-hydroxybutyryl-CoA dehydrogenase